MQWVAPTPTVVLHAPPEHAGNHVMLPSLWHSLVASHPLPPLPPWSPKAATQPLPPLPPRSPKVVAALPPLLPPRGSSLPVMRWPNPPSACASHVSAPTTLGLTTLRSLPSTSTPAPIPVFGVGLDLSVLCLFARICPSSVHHICFKPASRWHSGPT